MQEDPVGELCCACRPQPEFPAHLMEIRLKADGNWVNTKGWHPKDFKLMRTLHSRHAIFRCYALIRLASLAWNRRWGLWMCLLRCLTVTNEGKSGPASSCGAVHFVLVTQLKLWDYFLDNICFSSWPRGAILPSSAELPKIHVTVHILFWKCWEGTQQSFSSL